MRQTTIIHPEDLRVFKGRCLYAHTEKASHQWQLHVLIDDYGTETGTETFYCQWCLQRVRIYVILPQSRAQSEPPTRPSSPEELRDIMAKWWDIPVESESAR